MTRILYHRNPLTGMEAHLECPASMERHVVSVLEGEYDVPGLTFDEPPRVLDVGANVGAFSVWAARRWPGCQTFALEPNPAAFDLLERNTRHLPGYSLARGASDVRFGWPSADDDAGAIYLQPFAVREESGPGFLHFGANNLGEASLHRGVEQVDDGVCVDCVAARYLPDCDILKIDTEGCEVEILSAYVKRHSLPRAVLLEFHSASDRRQIDALLHSLPGQWKLDAAHYALVRGRIHSADRGVLAYVRSGA